MDAYEFCAALARRIDRETGLTVAGAQVRGRRTALSRPTTINEVWAALHRTLTVFAPLETPVDADASCSPGTVARILLEAIGEGRIPPRRAWTRARGLRQLLTAVLRLFLQTLAGGAERVDAFMDRDALEFHVWGRVMSDPAFVLRFARILQQMPDPTDRAAVTEAMRESVLEEIIANDGISIDDFSKRAGMLALTAPAALA